MRALWALTVANIRSYMRDRAALFWTLERTKILLEPAAACCIAAAERRRWHAAVIEDRPDHAPVALGELLRRQRAEREAGDDDRAGERLDGRDRPLDDVPKPDRFGVGHASLDRPEGLAPVVVGHDHEVPGGPKAVGEGLDARGETQGVVEQDDVSHRRRHSP